MDNVYYDEIMSRIKLAGEHLGCVLIADNEIEKVEALLPRCSIGVKNWLLRDIGDRLNNLGKYTEDIIDNSSFSHLSPGDAVMSAIGNSEEIHDKYILLTIANSVGYEKSCKGIEELFKVRTMHIKKLGYKDGILTEQEVEERKANIIATNKRMRKVVRDIFIKERGVYDDSYFREQDRLKAEALERRMQAFAQPNV